MIRRFSLPCRRAAQCLIGIAAAFFISLGAAELHLVVTADLHGRAEALARLAPEIRRFGDDAIRIDIGDIEQGTFLSSGSDGVVMMKLLNALKYDFFVPGNHDFELGRKGLAQLCETFDGHVLGADWQWGNCRREAWHLVRRNGVGVAVIGLTDPRMSARQIPGDDTHFSPPEEAVEAVMPAIRAAAPDLVVLAWHNGIYWQGGKLTDLLRTYPEIDLIAGAHTHEETPGKLVSGRFFVQTGARGEAAVHIVITIDDKSRRIISIRSELLRPAASAARDLLEIIDRNRPEDRFIAKLDSPLRQPAPGEHNSFFGRLNAAALAEAARCDAALVQQQARALEMQNKISTSGLYRLLPFRNRICTLEISRDELRELLNERLEYIRNRPAALAAAGFDFSADRHGVLIELSAPPELTLAVTDFLVVSSPLLRRLAAMPEHRFCVLENLTERDAVADKLRRL